MHLVLVPGFAGFDALGQLEYYAGVTPLFRKWQKDHTDRATAALHYFDNFPTAAVATRAQLLTQYLSKRIARGEFAGDDRIALIGHSTGGLDIRSLLWHLAQMSGPILVDGGMGEGKAAEVAPDEVLQRVHRVVFISVPQWGTNIADWVKTYRLERKLVVAQLRATVAASQIPLLDTLERLLLDVTVSCAETDLFLAVQDALRETEVDTRRRPMGTAMAQEAASLLELWLRHMATDFHAIDDLTARVPAHKDSSPAHFNLQQRDQERRIWQKYGIKTRSFATRGNAPFNFGQGLVPRWDLLKPWTGPGFNQNTKRAAQTDIVYRICYRACAGGPFAYRPNAGKQRPLAPWESDGIVNTASMFWPDPGQTQLVEADHMDIVGHYERVPAIPGSDRRFQAYDLLKSDSGFTSVTFNRVWNDIFDFCIPR
jgi:pimeloyl-ACP methyl ester carboxylesterase